MSDATDPTPADDPDAGGGPTPALPAGAVDLASLAARAATFRSGPTEAVKAAADLVDVAAQAGRLGVTVDAAEAIRRGISPNALRLAVVDAAAALSAASAVIITRTGGPPGVGAASGGSPVVAAAKKTRDAQLAERSRRG